MLVRESISFERGMDPKKAMGIGVEGQIAQYAEDVFDWALIDKIVDDRDLTIDTKKSWITHLLKTNPDKYDFNENAMYWFEEQNFDYLTPLPNGKSWPITGNIDLRKDNGQWIVDVNDMSDFADLFDPQNTKVSNEFISGVLGGDAYQFFESEETGMSTEEIINYFETNIEEIESYDYLEDLYIFKGGEEDRDNIKAIIEGIYGSEEFEELKNAINNAFMDADENAREGEAYKQIKKEIWDHYEFGTETYDDNSNTYKINTTITGANKLARVATIGDDYIDLFPARDGYWAETDPEYFNERLKSNLELHVS